MEPSLFPWEFPEVNDLVITSVSRITDVGIYVILLEYNNIEGFISLNQVSRRRFKNPKQIVRENERIVCQVLAVDKNHIDLNRKNVDLEDHDRILKRYNECLHIFTSSMSFTTQKGIDFNDFYTNNIWKLYQRYGKDIIQHIRAQDEIKTEPFLSFVRERFPPLIYKIRAVIDVRYYGPEGVDKLKEILSSEDLTIRYLSSPRYSVEIETPNKEDGLKKMYQGFEEIKPKATYFRLIEEPVVMEN
jgi:translation initiation factor 2 subunit 1